MKKDISDALIQYSQKIGKTKKKEKHFTLNLEADELIRKNPLAYVFGVILDQGMKAEIVWGVPYLLKKRLGHFDIKKIANINGEKIKAIFLQKPMLHRFPRVMASRIKNASQLILYRYDGKAENVWNDNPRSGDLLRRFEEFDGIGQKKASMATNILVRDIGIKVKDRRGIDISYDIHVRRVFLRSGLVEKDDPKLMIQTARKLNPEYPGILDNPCWVIGRKKCHPQNPKCDDCPITEVCPKLLNIKLPEPA